MFQKLLDLSGLVLPAWARWGAIAALAGFAYLFGHMDGERVAGERHMAYITAQAAAATQLVKAQIQVLTKTETKFRDRIQTIYLKGDEIEKSVPSYVTAGDVERFGVNAGFVRVVDAAWLGAPAGPPAESDREPAAISLADAADVEAHNATSCLAWREQALGLRAHYAQLQQLFNGSSQGK